MNYGPVARWYQFLSKLIFGNTLVRAQHLALSAVPENSHLLIAGGGDGEVLRHLPHPECPIDFVEISPEMLRLAKQKNQKNVRWFQQDIFAFRPDKSYDVILIAFLLDNFIPKEAKQLIAHLRHFLRKEGQIIIVDYTETPSFPQKILLQAMYLFFRIVANVQVKSLPPIERIMQENGFRKTGTLRLYRGFIEVKHYHPR